MQETSVAGMSPQKSSRRSLTKWMIFWHSEIFLSNHDIYKRCQIFARCWMSNIYFVHIAMSDCELLYWHFRRRAESYLIFVTDTRTVSVEKKSVMWRNFKFLYMTDVEKSEISPHVDYFTWQMWRNLKFLHMWSNFTFLNMTNVEKSEISPHAE